jgi:hypothetical protein
MLEVIKDFEKALEDEDNCDVIIKAGEDSKELRAHSFVLRTRCPYFKRALSEDWEEKDDDGNFIFKKPNISVEVFQLILRQVNNFLFIQRLYCLKLLFLITIILNYFQVFVYRNCRL